MSKYNILFQRSIQEVSIMRTNFNQNLIILIRRMTIMSPANKALWLRLALPLLPPRVNENTLHPVEYQKENKQRALLQSNTVRGTVLPGLCLPHWKQDRATGLCEPYCLHPGPLKPESIKSSKVGKTLFLIKINFLLFVMSKMPQLQPATLHFPLHSASLQAHM